MTAITEIDVVQACRTLFGADINISKDFLHTMHPRGIKSAFRKKAKEHHPDLFAANPVHIQQRQTALFRDIVGAYDILNHYFKQRESGTWNPAQTPRPAAKRTHPNAAPARPARASAFSQPEENMYRGNVPDQVLQIGQFLYYRGRISFDALIASLVWQRKQRPSMGDIALLWGWIDAAGLEKISRACERLRLFGEKAVEMGLLTVFQVNAILLYQQANQDRLGNYFIQHGLSSEEELSLLVEDLKEHNAAVLSSIRPSARSQAVYS